MLNVVAAVIHNSHGQLLLAQRPLHKHQGGLWEFAGGKVDAGETAEQALVRELQEELGITATQYRSLLTVEHHYPDKSVRLNVFRVTAFDGEAHGAEGQPIAWVKPENLYDYQFPAANVPILKAAVLPDMYCMTPEPTDVGGDLFAWLNQHLAQHSFLC
ncbi:MAG TPA: 8-oxo-dGTP diphosphatase MutT, partial [Agitococcus sp.]|nr:8-oxo-dGTP diphosphatase MutT [Agitococcus sp.]